MPTRSAQAEFVDLYAAPLEPIFIDSDDGTLIHIYITVDPVSPCGVGPFDVSHALGFSQNVVPNTCSPLEFATGTQTTTNCGSFSVTYYPEQFVLEMVDPLPEDFEFLSGSISRFPDRLSLILEEWTPSRIGSSLDTDTIGNKIAKTYITRYDFINTATIGTSDGSADQSFDLSGSDVELPTKGTPTVYVGGLGAEKWTVVEDLATQSATAKVFEYDETAGEVTFGDGVNGAIPTEGSEIVLRISIRNGGGKWEFVGIIKQPQDGITLTSPIKSCRDKVLYGQTKVAIADASKITNVHTKMNVIVQKEVFGAAVLAEYRYWSLTLGGEVTADGGDVLTLNTSIFSTYALEQFKRAEGQAPIPCRNHDSPSPVTCGSINDRQTHVPLTVDTNTPYPSFAASAQALGNQLISTFASPMQVVEMTPLRGGAITHPKKQQVEMMVFPIFEVWEVIQHSRLVVHAPNIDGQPCSVQVVSDPKYFHLWFTWPEIFYRAGIESQSGQGNDAVWDTEGDNHCKPLTTPYESQGFGNAFTGVSNLRMIKIGHLEADYDNQLRTYPGRMSFEAWFGPGPNPGPSFPYRYDVVPTTGGAWSTGMTIYGDGLFGRSVIGSDTPHPEWATMKWEAHPGGTDYNTYMFGNPLLSDFICEWTTEEGEITNLASVIFKATQTLNQQNQCVNITISQESSTPHDARIGLMKSVVASIATAGSPPFSNC